ncbi:FkbM family methyltransferase [Pleurocapsa sp. FMAR1]|uniref:FkbM family methyltransferase n=1 Tax=Pleurocapsa sp. FMAR1 TaxID=3040204 RepID=UPI0029C6BE28|nr:FkbM family methyltransferase [Pleurocapsa sp. FMAR1]
MKTLSWQQDNSLKRLLKQIRVYLGQKLLESPTLLKFVNFPYEYAPEKIRDFFVKHISVAGAPRTDYTWILCLSNKVKLKVPVKNGDLKSWQFAQSYKWHERGLRKVEDFLHNNIPIEKVFLDIGANLGIRSLYPLSLNRPVVLFEPNSYLRSFTEELFALNNFKKFTIENICLGNHNTTTELFISKSSYLSSVIQHYAELDEVVDTISVPMMKLDDYNRNRLTEKSIGALKIDVEGFEIEVLSGAMQLLIENKPVVIVEAQHDNWQKIADFFDNLNLKYKGFLITNNVKAPLIKNEDNCYHNRGTENYLYCCNRDLLSTLKKDFL